MKRFLPLLLLPCLGGCVTTGGGSVTGGECKVFEAPKYAIRGATQYDQDWADSTIEGGVGACKWVRPAPRPAELDAPKAAPKPHKLPAKKNWLWRLKWPHKAVAPVVNVPEVPVAVTPIADPPPAPPPAPRSVIDELLNPTDAK